MVEIERPKIFFQGLKELDRFDQEKIRDIIYDEYIKLERELKKIIAIRIHFKKYERGGREKYSIKMYIDAPTRPFAVTTVYNPVEWDPVAIIHKLFDKARQQIVHRLKTDTSYRKPYF